MGKRDVPGVRAPLLGALPFVASRHSASLLILRCNTYRVTPDPGERSLSIEESMPRKLIPSPKQTPQRNRTRAKTEIERVQEKEQALRTSDAPKKRSQDGGPMAVGVNQDHSTGRLKKK
jgi:hypothetical protein